MDNLIDWFYGQVVGFLGNFFAEMGNMGVELFALDWVEAIVLFFSQLGWALFGVSLVVSGFEFGIEYSTGRGNLQHTALNAIKGFMAVSLFTVVPVRLYSLSVSLQGTFAIGLTGAGTSIGTVGERIIEELMSIESLADMAGAPSFAGRSSASAWWSPALSLGSNTPLAGVTYSRRPSTPSRGLWRSACLPWCLCGFTLCPCPCKGPSQLA